MALLPGTEEELITEINVTPFVDVVLVLLILFMIAAPVAYQSALRVELPSAVTGEAINHVTLKFFVTEDGGILLDGRSVPAPVVAALVREALALDSRADAIVFADRKTPHGGVVELMDSIKRAGISQVALGVEKAAPGPAAR